MKKIIVGCCLTIVGAFSDVALLICASLYINSVSGWSINAGKFITTVENTGLSVLIIPIIISTILLFMGLYILLEEYLTVLKKKAKILFEVVENKED